MTPENAVKWLRGQQLIFDSTGHKRDKRPGQTANLIESLAKDAERWQAMRERLVGLDYEWGDPPAQVAVFALPEGVRVGAGPRGADAIADAARKREGA